MPSEKKCVKRIGWVMMWRLHVRRKWNLMPDRKIHTSKAATIRWYGTDTYKECQHDGLWRLKPVYVEVEDAGN